MRVSIPFCPFCGSHDVKGDEAVINPKPSGKLIEQIYDCYGCGRTYVVNTYATINSITVDTFHGRPIYDSKDPSVHEKAMALTLPDEIWLSTGETLYSRFSALNDCTDYFIDVGKPLIRAEETPNEIIAKYLSDEKTVRYKSANAFRDDVENHLFATRPKTRKTQTKPKATARKPTKRKVR